MHDLDALPTGPAGQLIVHHGMSLIPVEGAWFALTHVSEERIPAEALPPRYAGTGSRPAGNVILALITRRDFSALHRLRSAETWHFYGGDPAELLLLHPDGRAEVLVFGSESLRGQHPQITVPAGVWMGARPVRDAAEAYTFFGCTLSPGFDYSDYEPGYREPLAAAYPAEAGRIAALTREAFIHAPATAIPGHPPAPPSAGDVFRSQSLPSLAIGPGVSLQEIIGRAALGRSENLSITRFRLEPGAEARALAVTTARTSASTSSRATAWPRLKIAARPSARATSCRCAVACPTRLRPTRTTRWSFLRSSSLPSTPLTTRRRPRQFNRETRRAEIRTERDRQKNHDDPSSRRRHPCGGEREALLPRRRSPCAVPNEP